MKQHGFLRTSAPVADRRKTRGTPEDPLANFKVAFYGPPNSSIKVDISGASNLEKPLWEILFTRNELGWRPLHFAVLDYFCEKYGLELDVFLHEYTITEKSEFYESRHFYDSTLVGDWTKYPLIRQK